MMQISEGMAPFRKDTTAVARRCPDDKYALLPHFNLNPRQKNRGGGGNGNRDDDNDDNSPRRFRSGNGRNGNNNNDDDDNNNDSGRNRGNRNSGGGNRNGGSNKGNGNGNGNGYRNGGGSNRSENGGNGGRFRNGSGNGNGNSGGGNRGGNRGGNDSSDEDGGNSKEGEENVGNSNGNGSENGNGNGNRNRGSNRGNGGRNNGGNGRGNGSGNGGSRGGNNGSNGNGNGRFRDGNRNDDGDDDSRPSSSSSPESTSEPTPEPTAAPSSSLPEAAPTATETPVSGEPTTSAEGTISDAPTASGTSAVVPQPEMTPSPTLEDPSVTTYAPIITASEVPSSSSLVDIGENGASGTVPSSLAPLPTPSASPPPLPGPLGETPEIKPNDGDLSNGSVVNRIEPSESGMDRGTERVLISVSSIGAFIIVCFIVWMIWRLVRARRRRGQGRANVLGGLPKGLTSKVSFLRHRPELSLSGSTINGSPPPTLHEKSGSISSLVGGYYAPDKSQLQAQPQPQPRPQQQQQQQQQPKPQPQIQKQQQTQPMIMPDRSFQARYSESIYPSQIPEPLMYAPPPNGLNITNMASIPTAYAHQPQGSLSSTNAANFSSMIPSDGSIGTAYTTTVPTTLYYNQPMSTSQMGAAYGYRQPSMFESDVSSLSSGFGDGDIILPPNDQPQPPALAALPRAPADPNASPDPNNTGTAANYTTRFSWMSNRTTQTQTQPPLRNSQSFAPHLQRAPSLARSESVYTQTSEDHPARFRSLRSWVDQQTGRIHRAQARFRELQSKNGDGSTTLGSGSEKDLFPPEPAEMTIMYAGIPGIHNPPPEPNLGMMGDEERPRRVESALGGMGMALPGSAVGNWGDKRDSQSERREDKVRNV